MSAPEGEWLESLKLNKMEVKPGASEDARDNKNADIPVSERMASLKEKIDSYSHAINDAIGNSGNTASVIPPSLAHLSPAPVAGQASATNTTPMSGKTGDNYSPIHTLRSPFTNRTGGSSQPLNGSVGGTLFGNETTPLRPPGFPMPSPESQMNNTGGSPIFSSPTRITVTDAGIVLHNNNTAASPPSSAQKEQPARHAEVISRADDDEETSPVRDSGGGTHLPPTTPLSKSVTREIHLSTGHKNEEETHDPLSNVEAAERLPPTPHHEYEGHQSESEEEELSLEQLENARFTIDLLQDTLTGIVDRQGAFSQAQKKRPQSYFEPLAQTTLNTNTLMAEYQQLLATWDEHPYLNTTALAAYDDQAKAEFSEEVTDFYGECDSVKPHFEPIYVVQRRQEETERKIRGQLDDLQHKQRKLQAERRKVSEIRDKNSVVERALSHNEADTKRQWASFELESQAIEKRKGALQKREQRVGQWLRILEDRDEELGAKEVTLRNQLAEAGRTESALVAEKENSRRRSDFAASFKDPTATTQPTGAPMRPKSNVKDIPAPTNLRQHHQYNTQSSQQKAAAVAAKFGAAYEPHQQSIIRDDGDEEEEDDDEDTPNFEELSEDNDVVHRRFGATVGSFAPEQVLYNFGDDGTSERTPTTTEADDGSTTGEDDEEYAYASNVYMAPSSRHEGKKSGGATSNYKFTATGSAQKQKQKHHHQHVSIEDIDGADF